MIKFEAYFSHSDAKSTKNVGCRRKKHEFAQKLMYKIGAKMRSKMPKIHWKMRKNTWFERCKIQISADLASHMCQNALNELEMALAWLSASENNEIMILW